MKKFFNVFLLIFFVSANSNAEISGVNIGDLTQLYKEQITKILVGNNYLVIMMMVIIEVL